MNTTPVLQACLETPQARVVSVRGQERKRWAPVPLSTLEMQKKGTQYLRLPGGWVCGSEGRLRCTVWHMRDAVL